MTGKHIPGWWGLDDGQELGLRRVPVVMATGRTYIPLRWLAAVNVLADEMPPGSFRRALRMVDTGPIDPDGLALLRITPGAVALWLASCAESTA